MLKQETQGIWLALVFSTSLNRWHDTEPCCTIQPYGCPGV